ncbi:hypothetical protein PDJAM_G00192870, partial [Pangasius djambal]|nr:hypothetical protein [Pangasius djambal]
MLVTTPEAHVQHRYSEDHERGGAEQEHLPARAPASSSTAHHRGHVHASSRARALSLSLTPDSRGGARAADPAPRRCRPPHSLHHRHPVIYSL